MSYVADSVSVNDDGTITSLPAAKTGTLEVWVGDHVAHGIFWVTSTGAVTIWDSTGNVARTDSDTYLCVYQDDGVVGNIIIKNRLGSTKTVRYLYWYS